MSKVQIKRNFTPSDKPYSIIDLGPGHECLVDAEDLAYLSQFHWRAIKSAHCYYAIRRKTVGGKTTYIKMHRELSWCPKGLDCHHVNGNSLDNRKHNLRRMLPEDHMQLHANNPLREFFDQEKTCVSD